MPKISQNANILKKFAMMAFLHELEKSLITLSKVHRITYIQDSGEKNISGLSEIAHDLSNI